MLDLARRDADRVRLEDDETALLLALAREGKRVVRLGDLQNREQLIAALKSAGIAAEAVPG